jgi:predicted Zn-dependent peptidase
VIAYLLIALCRAEAPEMTPEVFRLENGLQVVMVEDHTLPMVSVQVWYRVGSADDDPGRPGLCHVVRTILERRTEPRPSGFAGDLVSGTLRDACYFSWVGPPESLDQALQIEAQRMRLPAVEQAEVENALRLTAQGRPCRPTEEDSRAESVLLAAAFPEHPYQHLPSLVAETLQGLSAAEVNEFVSTWFVPGNATLFVIGDLQSPAAKELIRQDFATLPWGEPPRRARPRAPEAEPVHLSPIGGRAAGLTIAWVVEPPGVLDAAALDVLMHLLCNPVDGSLYLRLTGSGYLPPRWKRESWRHAGLVTLTIETIPPSLTTTYPATSRPTADELAAMVTECLNAAVTTTPTEIRLDRARALAARDVRNRRRDFADRAMNLAWHEIVAGDLLLAEWQVPRIGRVSVGEVRRAAAELTDARTVSLPRVASHQEAMQPDTILAGSNGRTEGAMSRSGGSEFARETIRRKLASGLSVTIHAIPGLATTEVRTVVEPAPRLSGAMDALMAVGSTDHSVEKLRDYLSYHGLDLFAWHGSAQSGLYSRGPADRVEQMLELQAELIRRPNRSKAACLAAAEHGRQLSRWMPQLRSGNQVELYLPPGFIGWHAGINPPTQASELRGALDRLDRIEGVEIVVVGDVDPQRIQAAVRRLWADWRPPAGSGL